MDTVGRRIAVRRETLGLSQSALATRIGVAQPTIANWERDASGIATERLVPLADTLGVSVDWLLRGAEGPAPPRLTVEERLDMLVRELSSIAAEIRARRERP